MSDPIAMILFCPQCSEQHVDADNPDWDNPPHRSHQCEYCDCIWRPADVPTEGVAYIETIGKADTLDFRNSRDSDIRNDVVVDADKARG